MLLFDQIKCKVSVYITSIQNLHFINGQKSNFLVKNKNNKINKSKWKKKLKTQNTSTLNIWQTNTHPQVISGEVVSIVALCSFGNYHAVVKLEWKCFFLEENNMHAMSIRHRGSWHPHKPSALSCFENATKSIQWLRKMIHLCLCIMVCPSAKRICVLCMHRSIDHASHDEPNGGNQLLWIEIKFDYSTYPCLLFYCH